MKSYVRDFFAGDFMFVTKYRNEEDKNHMDLFISVHGERFVEARFPFSESKNFTHLDYHIIDVTEEGQIMVIVNHGPVLSNLYTSTRYHHLNFRAKNAFISFFLVQDDSI